MLRAGSGATVTAPKQSADVENLMEVAAAEVREIEPKTRGRYATTRFIEKTMRMIPDDYEYLQELAKKTGHTEAFYARMAVHLFVSASKANPEVVL